VIGTTNVSKSQHGGKVPKSRPQETIEIWELFMKVGSWLFYEKAFSRLVLRVGSRVIIYHLRYYVPTQRSIRQCKFFQYMKIEIRRIEIWLVSLSLN
jgi:hypothetical protein